jgi:hypothetical protein
MRQAEVQQGAPDNCDAARPTVSTATAPPPPPALRIPAGGPKAHMYYTWLVTSREWISNHTPAIMGPLLQYLPAWRWQICILQQGAPDSCNTVKKTIGIEATGTPLLRERPARAPPPTHTHTVEIAEPPDAHPSNKG